MKKFELTASIFAFAAVYISILIEFVGNLAFAGFLNPLISNLEVNEAGQETPPLSSEHHSLSVKVAKPPDGPANVVTVEMEPEPERSVAEKVYVESITA